MNNKRIGNQMERRVASALYSIGYWVHRLQDNHNGQPFDMIAIKNDEAFCIECKHCAGNRFKFDRLEFNQRNAFDRLRMCNSTGYVAIQFGNDYKFYLVEYSHIKSLELYKHSYLDKEELIDGYNCRKFNYC